MQSVAGLQDLERPFTIQEAKVAVWAMCMEPGSLMAFLQDFYDEVAPLDGLTVDDFRPISLQNCVMKIVTRILTTRLQHFIHRLISFEQSWSVKGRNIVNNFLYTADVVQSCQVRRLREILDLFSQATCLHINFHKSTFVPVGGVSAELASELASILGYPVSSFPQTYLGLPLSDHKLPTAALEFLSIEISKCIPGWRTSMLPIGGRLTLTATVMSALPSFSIYVCSADP
ncbi:uncharacterized protein [Lolium perenne]|uniref:uncharacterized protein n=1 Tax=Lolium perenne TaxID=4522 RepID=UPI003A992F64